MKTSWMIGVIMLWLLIFISEGMVTGVTIFNPATLNPALNMTILNGSNQVSTVFTIVTNLGGYIQGLFQILFLYQPSIFAGNYMD